jgi:hypothetical protein
MRRQRRRVETSARYRVDERLQIPLLRPAHIPGRKVPAALLVLTVVATRSVRPRQANLELFLVGERALHLYGEVADHDEPATITGEPGGQLDGIGRGRSGT